MEDQETEFLYRYKYLPFSEDSLKAISEGTIKFSRASEFNDPFDCRPYIDANAADDLIKSRPDLIKGWAKRQGWSAAESISRKRKAPAAIKRRLQSQQFAGNLLEPWGVCCLSKNPLNILMWSHYAEEHKGFVLEFKIPTSGYMGDELIANEHLFPPIEIPTVQYITQQRTTIWLL